MDRPGIFVGQMLFWVLLFGGVIWFAVYQSSRSRVRNRDVAARWQHAVAVCSNDPCFRLGRVDAVTFFDATQGTRAWVTWYGGHTAQDVWFANAWPPVGGWLVATGSAGRVGEPAFVVDRIHELIA